MTLATTPGADRTTELAHDCDPGTQPVEAAPTPTRRSTRLIGIDAARGLALIGMIAVHTISAATPDGELTLTWQLFSGRSAALFAVLGGAGIAFMTGRTRAPQGVDWARRAVTPLVRGILIAAVGLALGYAVSAEDALVILPFLGMMFIASTVLLPLRPRTLITLGLAWAVIGPVVSHVLRAPTVPTPATNLTWGHLFAAPIDTVTTLLVTGAFPVLTWMSYIAVGLGVGRSLLGSRRVIARLVGGGALLLLLAEGLTWLAVTTGVRDRIAADVAGHMPLDTFTEYMVWGGEGTLPADSPWWLAINAPHTGAPLDLLSTMAVALITIGLCLTAAMAAGPRALRVLTAPGSMTLTLYTTHVLLIHLLSVLPEVLAFAMHVVLLTVFALVWSSRFSKGPLEWVVATITHALEPARPRRATATS